MTPTFPEFGSSFRVVKSPDVTEPENWPKAPSKYAFIFEAINLTGKALFAADWTGKELAAVIWQQSPRQERAQAHIPPARGGGTGGSRTVGRIPLPKPRFDFHVQDWLAEQRQPLWEENRRALKRLELVTEWLAQRCRDGELSSFARLRDGGEIFPVRASEWNVDVPLAEFVVMGGSRRRFYEMGLRNGPFDSYVFFDRLNLQEMLARQPDAPLIVGEADLSRLSPYLQLAVRVALERGYFERGRCETMDVREAEIARAWPHFMPDIAPVDSTVKQLAKLITFPDPTAIKQGQRGARSRKTAGTRQG